MDPLLLQAIPLELLFINMSSMIQNIVPLYILALLTLKLIFSQKARKETHFQNLTNIFKVTIDSTPYAVSEAH
jgi:hypothetical protein